ncbi:MAG: tetratricopeptide repeat protein [Chloroflexi bacterium]|nr:tetratricopeptide repeat protein [Chloroflexota bacterium]
MGKRKKERVSEETFLLESAIGEIYAAGAAFGSVEVAESKLRSVLVLKPTLKERIEALNLLAQVCAQTVRHQEALEHFAAALAVGPGIAVPLTEGLAGMFEKQEEWEKAVEVYTRALACCEDASLHNGLGYCLAQAGRLREAEYHERRATELDPNAAVYVNDLGYVLLGQGEFQQARILFERALGLDPSYELARENLHVCSKRASQSGHSPGKAE